jgi:hypothetical protein
LAPRMLCSWHELLKKSIIRQINNVNVTIQVWEVNIWVQKNAVFSLCPEGVWLVSVLLNRLFTVEMSGGGPVGFNCSCGGNSDQPTSSKPERE